MRLSVPRSLLTLFITPKISFSLIVLSSIFDGCVKKIQSSKFKPSKHKHELKSYIAYRDLYILKQDDKFQNVMKVSKKNEIDACRCVDIYCEHDKIG